jgi:hypothetical protein
VCQASGTGIAPAICIYVCTCVCVTCCVIILAARVSKYGARMHVCVYVTHSVTTIAAYM